MVSNRRLPMRKLPWAPVPKWLSETVSGNLLVDGIRSLKHVSRTADFTPDNMTIRKRVKHGGANGVPKMLVDGVNKSGNYA